MGKVKMLGAVVGDIIGSPYEFYNTKSTDFELFTKWTKFTDDSVMTLAVAKWLMEDGEHSPRHLIKCMQELGRRYPRAGYGGNFSCWLRQENPQPYKSWGNGAGMRVSPVGLYAKTLDEALELASITASVSHNHPEGVKGAQAIASCVWMASRGLSKEEIKDEITEEYGYDLSKELNEIGQNVHKFDATCQVTVPEAIIAFLNSESYEDAIEKAILVGGDSDTIACMTGAIAGAYYGVPDYIVKQAMSYLPADLTDVVVRFEDFINKQRYIKEETENEQP